MYSLDLSLKKLSRPTATYFTSRGARSSSTTQWAAGVQGGTPNFRTEAVQAEGPAPPRLAEGGAASQGAARLSRGARCQPAVTTSCGLISDPLQPAQDPLESNLRTRALHRAVGVRHAVALAGKRQCWPEPAHCCA